MTNETFYTIGELANMAEVTPRTIRYYTTEGLLPPPDTRGRQALYSQDHLRRLQLIARLKEAYLPLGEIKARLVQLTDEQVRQLLAEYGQAPEPTAPTSAAEYVAQVLTGQALPSAPAAPIDAVGMQPRAALAESGEQRIGSQGTVPPRPPALQVGHVAPAAAPAPAAPGSLLRKLIPQRRERDAPVALQDAPGESWRRVTLAPGVELHLREPPPPDLRERVERLIAHARDLFRDRT